MIKIYGCEYQPAKMNDNTVTLVSVATKDELVMDREEYEDRLAW